MMTRASSALQENNQVKQVKSKKKIEKIKIISQKKILRKELL